ncbi:MAG: hypothetical protein NT047_07415 [Deltaproteobacteria bacterium]|nr:hypothetical protein [Deltaproteobacteria bacterium]
MRPLMRIVALAMILVAGALVWSLAYEKYHQIAKPEQYQLVSKDGKRFWFLDTGAIKLKTEDDSGIKYLEVYAKVTYTFTKDYDINHYWMQTANRQWQPIAAMGCDKEGNVIEH